jgi:hypothetical protein
VGLRVSLDAMAKRRSSYPLLGIEPLSSSLLSKLLVIVSMDKSLYFEIQV